MPRKAIISSSDSQNPVNVSPRRERRLTLTPLGYQAVKWIKQQEAKESDDEFAFFCCGCLRVLAKCRCSLDGR